MKKLLIYLFIHLLTLSLHGQSTSGIQVKVLDQEGRPLVGEPISIQNSAFYKGDANGEFMLPDKSLRLPVRAKFGNHQLEVLEIAYYEEEAKLEIKAHRFYHAQDVLKVKFDLKDTVLTEPLEVLVNGNSFSVGKSGVLSLIEPVRIAPTGIKVKGFEILEESRDSKLHELNLLLKPLTNIQEQEDTLMLSYEADFDRISRDLENERALYEIRNAEIQQEILNIRDKLLKEESIHGEQRKELKHYLIKMERVLLENSEVIRKSEERTREAVAKLRMIILEKDSLNVLALGKIEQMEEERAVVEENYKQKITIFIAVIIVLILIALIIYFFAVKLRKQKSWLKEVNKRLKNMQQDLTKSIQELNLRKAQIEDHNNQLELFVYKASHDIKGPLRSIIGLTQIGLQDVKETAAREYFQHINKSTQRLDNLLADLLRLTKAKQAEIEKKEIDFHSMVQEIIQSFGSIRGFDRLAIEVDIPENIAFMSDEKMIYSVLQNFIENGIKYFDPKKETPFLKVKIRQEEGKTIFLFEDNGLGIDEEHLPKIFDMFYKIDHQSEGTGLGLHIIKVTVKRLGGTIKVKSRAGQGSSFTITFYE